MMRAAIFTIDSGIYKAKAESAAASALKRMLEQVGFEVKAASVLPQEREVVATVLRQLSDSGAGDLILTTGGTGFARRDVTPEATRMVIEKEVNGIPMAILSYSLSITERAMLSRAAAGIRGQTLIINLPGSPKAVEEALLYILPSLKHGLEIMLGLDSECARPSHS